MRKEQSTFGRLSGSLGRGGSPRAHVWGALALVAATIIAVMLGKQLALWLNPRYLEGIAGMGFIVIGIFMLASFIKQP